MGDEVNRPSVASRVCARLAAWLSGLLEPDDRDVVRGDIAESRAGGRQALRDVLSVLVHRQAAEWMHWRPWLTLAVLVVPLGVLLGHASRSWTDYTVVEIIQLARLWDWALVANPGSREALVWYVAYLAASVVALAGWSWTCGFALGSLSRRTRLMSGMLFCLLVVVSTVGSTTGPRYARPALFSLAYYSVILPLFIQVTLVVLPAMSGLSRSVRRGSLPLLPVLGWAAAIAVVTAWTEPALVASVVYSGHIFTPDPGLDGVYGTGDDSRPRWFLPLIVVWPAAFMVASAARERWRAKAARA
jgi:hypothetical protein